MTPAREPDADASGQVAQPGDRDARTLRRGLLAALLSALVVGGAGMLAVLAAGAGGAAGLAAVVLALAVGAMVGAGWLLLAAALDLHAGQPISARRWRWTLALCVAAVVLVVAAPAALMEPAP